MASPIPYGDFNPADEYEPEYTVRVYRAGHELAEECFDDEEEALEAAAELLFDERYPWPTRAVVYHGDHICDEVIADPDDQHAEWPDHEVAA